MNDERPKRSDDGDRLRRRQNAMAFAVLLVLAVGGAWLIRELRASMAMEACVESGRRNCAPVEVGK